MRVFRRFLREVSTSSKRLPAVFQENTSVSFHCPVDISKSHHDPDGSVGIVVWTWNWNEKSYCCRQNFCKWKQDVKSKRNARPLAPDSMLRCCATSDLLCRGGVWSAEISQVEIQIPGSTLLWGKGSASSLLSYATKRLSEAVVAAWIFTCENSADNRLKSDRI